MKANKPTGIEVLLFIGSFIVLIYILFMNYAYVQNWDHTLLIAIMEFITIPAILLASIIPIIVVLRFIRKKTKNRTIAILTMFFSLLTAFLLGYTTF